MNTPPTDAPPADRLLAALRHRSRLLLAVATDLHAALAADLDVDALTAARLLLRLDRLAHWAEDIADEVRAEAPFSPDGAA